MSALQEAYITPEEYLVRECESEYKNEYFNGQVRAFASASRHYNAIALNAGAELRS